MSGIEFFVASGALAWDGKGWPWERPLTALGIIDPSLFTISTKSLTLRPNKGRWWAVRPMRGGTWNWMGMPNKGLKWWLEKYHGKKEYEDFMAPDQPYFIRKQLPYKTLLSIAPYSRQDARKMLNMIHDYELFEDKNFAGIELNISCPNVTQLPFEAVYNIVKEFWYMDYCEVTLKMNYKQAFFSGGFTEDEVKKLTARATQIALNSAPPLMGGRGAYSGKLAQMYNWPTADFLQKKLGLSVIWPSLWEYGDIQKVIDMGAKKISFGAIHLLRPWAPTAWVRRFNKENNNGSNAIAVP